MDLSNIEKKVRLFKLRGDKKPVAYQIRTKHKRRYPLLHTMEDGTVRELRYATNMNSPFVDEQDGKGTPTLAHIWFRDGVFTVRENDVVLAKFLIAHPDNMDNGGKIFYEVKPEDNAKQEIENLEAAASAMSIAQGMDIDDASAIVYANVGAGIDKYSSTEIRRDLLTMAFSNGAQFVQLAEDETVKIAWISHQALKFGVLKENQGIITFGSSKKKLLQIPPTKTVEEGLIDFFFTDDGIAALEEVKAKLKKLLS